MTTDVSNQELLNHTELLERKALLEDAYFQDVIDIHEALLQLACKDRQAATREANMMKDWHLPLDDGGNLFILVHTLVNFESSEATTDFLKNLKVMSNKDLEKFEGDLSLTVPEVLESSLKNHVFDCETGFFPNNHDYLLADLARLCPSLTGIHFSEKAPDEADMDTAPYQIYAELNGQKFHQKAENYGDWYDLKAVILMLNHILETISAPERFISLPTGDQCACLAVIEVNALDALLAKKLILSFEQLFESS